MAARAGRRPRTRGTGSGVMLGLSAINHSRTWIIICLLLVWANSTIRAHDIGYSSKENQLQSSDPDGPYNINQAIVVFKEVVRNISLFLDDVDSIGIMPPKCLTVQCRIICQNGRQEEIPKDISIALEGSSTALHCDSIEELHLYNYKFPNAVLPVGFLSTYINKIHLIYLCVSNITTIESGAFGGGIFRHIVLEDLQLERLEKGFFENISSNLKQLTIVQHNKPVQAVYPDFLDDVVFQLEFLRLEVGLDSVRNITATDPILGALYHADFSYNNFSSLLLEDSFNKLSMVEVLILSYSNIEYLPNYIFQGMKYLQHLDISHNNLVTISRTIFGIQPIAPTMRVVANSNPWHCGCALQTEMNEIFAYHNAKLDVFCATPEEYENWTVVDSRLCENASHVEPPPSIEATTTTSTTSRKPITTTPKTTTTTRATTTTSTGRSTTTSNNIFVPTLSTAFTVDPVEIVALECQPTHNASLGWTRQNIRWPQINFEPSYFGELTVRVSVEPSTSVSSVGLFWFSNTTKEYYMMELLPDRFGLGCYFTVPLLSAVRNLKPNVAYTFCLVDDGHNSVSPFSCKSVKVGGNLEANYDAWISKGALAKGISLMVLGVVLFMLLGMLAMYVVLRQRPNWVKGSKRIVKPSYRSGEIVVLPRSNTANKFRRKEQLIAESSSNHRCFCPRRSSLDSQASSDSYINTNLYEVIPSYITFDKIPQTDAPAQPGLDWSWSAGGPHRGSVRYAQITPRTKRISSDPLPALPIEANHT